MGKLIVTFHHDDLDEVQKTFRTYKTLTYNGWFREMDVGEAFGSGEKELNRLYAQGVNFIAYGTGLECGTRATISMNKRLVATPLDDYGRLVVVVDGFTEHGLVYDSEDEESALKFLRLRQELLEQWGASGIDAMDQRGSEDESGESESFIEAIEEADRRIGAALTKLLELTESNFESLQVRTLEDKYIGQRKVSVFVHLKEK